MNQAPPHGRAWVWWGSVAVGWALMGAGIAGLFADAETTVPSSWAVWFFGSLAAHDALAAPLACGLGALVARFLPGWARTSVQCGLFAAAVVTLVSIPLVRGWGARADNPSLQPRNYAVGTALVLGLIALMTLAGMLRGWLHRKGAEANSRMPSANEI